LLVARIARLENLKDALHERFVQVGAGYSAGLRGEIQLGSSKHGIFFLHKMLA